MLTWTQLAPDFFADADHDPPDVPPRRDEPLPPQRRDPVAGQIRSRATCARPRHRQGVFHREALPEVELLRTTRELRLRVEAGDPTATLVACALVLGVGPELAPDIALRPTESPVQLDVERGCFSIDFGRFFLTGAAKAPANETSLPACHVLS